MKDCQKPEKAKKAGKGRENGCDVGFLRFFIIFADCLVRPVQNGGREYCIITIFRNI